MLYVYLVSNTHLSRSSFPCNRQHRDMCTSCRRQCTLFHCWYLKYLRRDMPYKQASTSTQKHRAHSVKGDLNIDKTLWNKANSAASRLKGRLKRLSNRCPNIITYHIRRYLMNTEPRYILNSIIQTVTYLGWIYHGIFGLRCRYLIRVKLKLSMVLRLCVSRWHPFLTIYNFIHVSVQWSRLISLWSCGYNWLFHLFHKEYTNT